MIGTAELAAMRAAQALTLTQTATILRVTEASDGAGGQTRTWASAGTAACRVAAAQTNQAQLTQFAARLGESVGWRVTLDAGTDVRSADRLQVGTRQFEVLGVMAAWTYETARVCLCVERDFVAVAEGSIESGNPIGLLLALTYA